MKSKVAVTYQIDEPDVAAEELRQGVYRDFQLQKNSIGILFCYSDTDLGELAALLREKLPFEIVGCTAIATMDREGGFHELAATLLVLTADDCVFATSLSAPITPNNVQTEVTRTYQALLEGLGGAPGLLFALPPYILEIMLDAYTIALGEIAPGVPVVGGLPSHNASGDANLLVYGGETHPDRMILLGVSGNVSPVFAVQTVAGCPTERKRRVTGAKGNVIYRVGDQSFTEYLAEIGLPYEKLSGGNSTISFVSNPLLLEHARGDGEENITFLRTLHEVNAAEGSGTAIGQIPEDAVVSICPLHRSAIAEAAERGIAQLNNRMDAAPAGYRFSTVLAVSCIGRYLVMSPNSSVEVDRLLEGFRGGLTLSGFYSYGEIGPLALAGGSIPFAHNESLVLCAF